MTLKGHICYANAAVSWRGSEMVRLIQRWRVPIGCQ